jgi:hypothetical protein
MIVRNGRDPENAGVIRNWKTNNHALSVNKDEMIVKYID